jgi:hypothetical protein
MVPKMKIFFCFFVNDQLAKHASLPFVKLASEENIVALVDPGVQVHRLRVRVQRGRAELLGLRLLAQVSLRRLFHGQLRERAEEAAGEVRAAEEQEGQAQVELQQLDLQTVQERHRHTDRKLL